MVGVDNNFSSPSQSQATPIDTLVANANAAAAPPVAVAAALREIGVALAAVSSALKETPTFDSPADQERKRVKPAGAGAEAAMKAMNAEDPEKFNEHVSQSLNEFYAKHAPSLIASIPDQIAALEGVPANFGVMCDILEQAHGASPLTSWRASKAHFPNDQVTLSSSEDSGSDSEGHASDSSSSGEDPADGETIEDLLHDSLTTFYKEHDPKMVPQVGEILVRAHACSCECSNGHRPSTVVLMMQKTIGGSHANFVILEDALEAQYGGGPKDVYVKCLIVILTHHSTLVLTHS